MVYTEFQVDIKYKQRETVTTFLGVLARCMSWLILFAWACSSCKDHKARNTEWKILAHSEIQSWYLLLTKQMRKQLRHEIRYLQSVKMCFTCAIYLYHIVDLEKYSVLYFSHITFVSFCSLTNISFSDKVLYSDIDIFLSKDVLFSSTYGNNLTE